MALLHFDEPGGSLVFTDMSGGGNGGACADAGTCPVAGAAARVDTGISFDGVNDMVRVPYRDNIDFATSADFSVAFWVTADPVQPETKYPDNVMVEKWAGSNGYPFAIRYLHATGKVYGARWDGTHGPAVTSTTSVNDGKFHHVAFVKRGTQLYMYVDGMLEASVLDSTVGSTKNASPLYLGSRPVTTGVHFRGALDELAIYPHGLSDEEVRTLFAAGQVTWQRATVVVPASDTITQTTWSLPVPTTLEGLYQVDVRGADAAGNRNEKRSDWNGWRGPIDEVAPRLGITVTIEGYGTAATTKYDCDAVDFGLSDPSVAGYDFGCPCPTTTWQRTTFHDLSEWYRETFTDTTRLYHLAATCTLPGAITTPVSVRACDISGHCNERAAGARVPGHRPRPGCRWLCSSPGRAPWYESRPDP